MARDAPETELITIKPESVSHAAEPFSWAPLRCCSLPGRSFLIKALALSAHVSPWTIHFWVLSKNPHLGLGSGPPSRNTITDHCWSKSNHSSSSISSTDFLIKSSFIYLGLVKKAENQRIDAFELWCWRRLLRVPWTTRRSNQSLLMEINLEGMMLKLKL